MLTNGAGLSSSSLGEGTAGEVEVTAGSIRLDQGSISSQAASGDGGNITLSVQERGILTLRRGSNISTTAGTAQAGGDGGNISINSPFIVVVPSENSDISANAFTGRGGRVDVAAQGIFGIQFRPRLTSLSDITASSDFGVDGVVEINTPDVDPSLGLVALAAELVDASRLIASGCGATPGQGQSEFIVTGRGGLPPNPTDALSSDTVWTDLRSQTQLAQTRPSSAVANQPTNSKIEQIVEATEWVINNKGSVVLTATAPTVTPHSFWGTPTTCHAPETSS